MNQYSCGRYARSARETAYGGVTFGLYRRSEIYWDPECEVDRDDVYQSRNPVYYCTTNEDNRICNIVGCCIGRSIGCAGHQYHVRRDCWYFISYCYADLLAAAQS